MFEHDYIMRLISEIVRFICKLVFNIDTESPPSKILETKENQEILNNLLRMIDTGNINEAENQLSEHTQNPSREEFALAVLFYTHLNEKSDEFLEEHHFSREEVLAGLQSVAANYGLEDLFQIYS